VSLRRLDRDDYHNENHDAHLATMGLATLHNQEPSNLPSEIHRPREHANGEDKISIFWRVFGGTILSIVALVAVTIYNNMTTSISELRNELSRANEARAEMVKKADHSTTVQTIYNRLQEIHTLQVGVTSIREQFAGMIEKQTACNKEFKESGDVTRSQVTGLKDKLTSLEAGQKQVDEDHKVIQKMQVQISTVSEKLAAKEAVIKTLEDEKRVVTKEMQELRERIAKIEGQNQPKRNSSEKTGGE
jgi:predicted  nucleic acid-binding Zn-ribbon protein